MGFEVSMMFSITIVFEKKFPFVSFNSAKGRDWVYTYATRKNKPCKEPMIRSFMERMDEI